MSVSNKLFASRAAASAAAAIAVFGWALTEAAATEVVPAQIPLSSRVAEPPIPNVLVTIDDSGSMLADYVPETDFVVNGKTINFAPAWVGAFPGDPRKLNNPGDAGDHPFPNGNYLEGVVTSLKGGESVWQMQFRSPDVNAIWYNPDIRYDPWFLPDGTARMAAATPATARFDPLLSTPTFNLTKTLNYNTKWYVTRSSTSTGSKAYAPGLVYRLKAGADPTATANYTRYDVNATDGSHAPATKNANRTDCVGTKCTQLEELQNFANWFTYYRMRESLTKAAITESFVAFKDKLRVGWGRINKSNATSADGVNFKIIETAANGGPMRPLDATRLKTVLTGVQKITSWPSTPLRTALDEVGRYFDRSGTQTGSPWLTDPGGDVKGEKLTCRRSVSLLFTDGYYNDTYTAAGDVDGVDGPDYSLKNPNGYQPTRYTHVRPFIDAPGKWSNTLADVSMKYFVKDLDTTIDNKVPPVSNDIAFWQHLSQFMVGLGVSGTLDASTAAKKTETLKAITDGKKFWPDPSGGGSIPAKIDDMWHAAVNTGGDFYSVRNVTELTTALKDAFGKSAGNEAKEAGVATSSGYVVEGNVKYVPKYKSVSWWGDLEAWPLGIDGKEGDAVLWRASENMPAHTARSLYVWNGVAGTPSATKSVPFTWAGMGAANQALVDTAYKDMKKSEKLTNYIRGDQTDEGFGFDFRSRAGKVLGDFVNSPPVMVKGLVDLGYSAFSDTYSDFVNAKRARATGLVFVGGNDGILHAFNANVATSNGGGKELYGYLPSEGLTRLWTIADKEYGTPSKYHRFFVDGPVNETDAFITTPGGSTAEWANLVIGSMGAGGKTFFMLHVPTKDPTTIGANALVWEVSGTTDKDVGYMFADFAVGKLKNGGWKAFVGNGVYSTNGHAVLLVVNLETGAIEGRLEAESTSGNNGLMGVSLIKDEKTQEVMGAYAGDLMGNLWRFDFDGPTSADWHVGFTGPLFQAGRPITIAPSMVVHPDKGRVVLFGTGRLIDEPDSDSNEQETFYGIWDPTVVGKSSWKTDSPFKDAKPDQRSLLQAQGPADVAVEGGKYFKVVTYPVDWKVKHGWYLDLPFDHQRVIFPSYILADTYVLFSTSVPATEAAMCSSTSGVGYNYLLVAADGTAPSSPTFDTNGDGVIDEKDEVASGFLTGNDGRDAIVSKTDDEECVKGHRLYLDCHTGKTCEWLQLDCGKKLPGDRIFQQIMNPPTPPKK